MTTHQPPIILQGDLRNPTTSSGAPATGDTIVPTAPARFAVFPGDDTFWVLRDYREELDYPFLTKASAIGGMEVRLHKDGAFLGSPMEHDVYGPLTENAEFFA